MRSKAAPIVRRILVPHTGLNPVHPSNSKELSRESIKVRKYKSDGLLETVLKKESPTAEVQKMASATPERPATFGESFGSSTSGASSQGLATPGSSQSSASPRSLNSSIPRTRDFDFNFDFDKEFGYTPSPSSSSSRPPAVYSPGNYSWSKDFDTQFQKLDLKAAREADKPKPKKSSRVLGRNEFEDDIEEEETERKKVSFGLIYEASRAAFWDEHGESYFHEHVQNPELGIEFIEEFQGKKPGYVKASRQLLEVAANFWTNDLVMAGDVSIHYINGTIHAKTSEARFQIKLDPLAMKKSNRFFRKFGSDRFLFLRIPELPKEKKQHARMKKDIENWIGYGIRAFDRWWRPFHIKPSAKGASFQIIFFAESGYAIGPSRNPDLFETVKSDKMTAEELLEWHIPLEKEMSSTIAKIQSRIDLGFSDSIPSITFQWEDLVFVKDNVSPINEIMDDGCAVASPAVFRRIAEELGLETMPTAIQGRLGGAKGVWFIDPDTHVDSDQFFICLTPSMTKYAWHEEDASYADADPHRLTLDIIYQSKPPKEGQLNVQFLPILYHGGVPFDALREVTLECFDREIAELEAALDSPLKLRYWLNRTEIIRELTKIETHVGALPTQDKAQIEMLIDAGFEADKNVFMKHVLQTKVVDKYWARLMKKLHIAIPMSTNLICIADPTGLLEEGEVWLSFSEGMVNTFRKRKEQHITGDILVARNPALLPSDIQKVRAVEDSDKYRIFRDMKDVIIFSTKGDRSLASMLSGGDYDGDKVWITWDPRLVEPFNSQPLPAYEFDKSHFFNTREETIADCPPGEILKTLISSAIEPLSTGKVELGTFNNMHANYLYLTDSPNDQTAYDLARICSYLVDAQKQGLTLKENAFAPYGRYRSFVPPYKEGKLPKDLTPELLTNICDRICFNVIQTRVSEARTRSEFKPLPYDSEDPDLALLYHQFDNHKQRVDRRTSLYRLSEQLKSELEELMNAFVGSAPKNLPSSPSSSQTANKSASTMQQHALFESRANTARQAFLSIDPYQPSTENALYLGNYWQTEGGRHDWNLYKASVLYKIYHRRQPKLIWWVCAKELCELKARAGVSGFRPVREEIFGGLTVDKRRVRAVEAEEDEFFYAEEFN